MHARLYIRILAIYSCTCMIIFVYIWICIRTYVRARTITIIINCIYKLYIAAWYALINYIIPYTHANVRFIKQLKDIAMCQCHGCGMHVRRLRDI